MKMRVLVASACVIALVVVCAGAAAQEKRAMKFEDLAAMGRLGDQQISPDGKWVAYTVATPSLPANRLERNLWLVPVAGGEARQLTTSGRDQRPVWSPDSKKIAFQSSRGGEEGVYVLSLEGGDPVRVAHPADGADNLLWSPDGKTLAFTSNVFPDCRDDACTAERLEKREKSKVKARMYDHLLFRHWTEYSDGTRSHLFVVSAKGGTPRDLTPGGDYDVPPFSLGGPDEIAFSPNGQELCFTANTDAKAAVSTNGDLWLVPVDGSAQPRRITTNPGYDGGPVYSPDGKSIAYHAQLIAGYEADRWRLMLYDRTTGTHTNLTENFDRSVDAIVWSPDSKTLYFDAEDRQTVSIFRMAATPGALPEPVVRIAGISAFGLTADGRTLVFTNSSIAAPAEIYTANADGKDVRQITDQNTALLAQLDLKPAEHFTFKASDGREIYAMLVRPPGFDPAKKYPMVLLAHGGPQTMWDDAWSYRWSPELFVSPGYVALMINRRGSTGFGQKFTDEIQDDWGGKAYTDLLEGTEYALKKYPFIDGARMVAGGGSYGGFMMDWFATHGANGRFKALFSHAGVYNQVSMNATEELWFPNHEFKGTPWSNPASYAKWSAATTAGDLSKYKIPTLVIAGELDYRVPYTQSLEFFTALQLQGVPSKLLLFPDEGHWILKPQNSQFWYKNVMEWIATYVK